MMTKLCEMALKHNTDKIGWYTEFYDLVLGARRPEVKRVLEVGIGTAEAMAHIAAYMPGASLYMWRDYFPNAEVWGVDSDRRALTEAGNVRTIHADSTDKELPARLPGDFDLIVDDGCHRPDVQFDTFLNLFPVLKDGGLYIIEDAEGWPELSVLLEGYSHHVVFTPRGGKMGKLILIRK